MTYSTVADLTVDQLKDLIRQLRQVRELVEEHADFSLEKWYEHLKRR